ncbi:hypothetical protein L9F63_019252 [Diploptera punctata]|uniref:Cytochrome P450 n=1 Tax=Diploptera punctata TaxID=6984 RepID=A0AAD7ZWR5_DIPPU|nr:hypothetical protein L9F63_019252 [Diploptera punctata]
MLTALLSLVALCIFLGVTYYNKKMKPMFEKAANLPGPKTLPIIGNALQFGTNTKAFLDYIFWLTKEHGPIARVWIGPVLGVMLADAKYIEIVLGSNKLVDKAVLYKFGEPWLAQGMLTNKGATWKKHKKIIANAFNVKVLDKFISIYNENTNTLLNKLEAHVDGSDFDIYPYFNLFALDTICESAMGVKINTQKNDNSEYVDAVQLLGDAMFIRAFNPWLHPDILFNLSPLGRLQKKCIKILQGISKNVIKTRKEHLIHLNSSSCKPKLQHHEDNMQDIGVKEKQAFLDLLIQAVHDGDYLSDQELQEEVDTIMLAGHDTTTSALSFASWLLAKHPDIQNKVLSELEEIFGDSDRAPTSRDFQEMKYMEMVIKETLRLYPSVPIYGRLLTEDVPLGDGYILPAGTNVGFNPYMLHRNPEYFPDPEKFDPDRFLPENSIGRHPYCYIPFSAGPRVCLGMRFAMLEMKCVLSALLRKYELLPPNPNHKLDLTVVLVLKSLTGIPVRLRHRR